MNINFVPGVPSLIFTAMEGGEGVDEEYQVLEIRTKLGARKGGKWDESQ
jgi:hypothetical protein